jgi:serine/threonine protein phosphatase PrpC
MASNPALAAGPAAAPSAALAAPISAAKDGNSNNANANGKKEPTATAPAAAAPVAATAAAPPAGSAIPSSASKEKDKDPKDAKNEKNAAQPKEPPKDNSNDSQKKDSTAKADTSVAVVKSGHHSAQGIRLTMEDEVVIHDSLAVTAVGTATGTLKITSPLSIYGVFDGHGGKKAAEYTKENLVNNIVAELQKGKEVKDACIDAFNKTDDDFIRLGKDTSGTTAVVLLFEHSTKRAWCANAGDSRCILAREGKALALSEDHKADRPDELDRIRKAGGFVIHKRVMGELAISRAIGDADFKEKDFKLVLSEPEVKEVTFGPTDDFVVLACDGLYDVMTNDEIVKYVADLLPAESNLDKICEKIVDHAIKERNTRDNVSAIVVKLK